jgi:shikimate kinase
LTGSARDALDPRWRRIVLVGFMGAGKTSVGTLLARRTGWRFVDIDQEIEAEAGRTIPEIFATDGEAAFRRWEADAVARWVRQDHVVLAPGGGWAVEEGRLEGVPPGTATVWLRVAPEEAVRRAGSSPGQRPLLAGDDPLRTARRMLEARTPRYAAARWRVDTERSSVEDVTAQILNYLAAQPLEHTD